ncbi:MAG: TonB-dependent receptor plug domain-containing protein [Massilia sp.]
MAKLALASAVALPALAAEQVVQGTETPPAAAPASARPAAKPAAKPAEVQQVQVNGSRANDTDLRRNATASKMVFGREELDRNGDSSIGEILKRLPGVTMGGPPGRGGGGVRMRGMGNGYTQMLVNGERPPAGFSLESLAPDQVERIEIMRGPVAEHSTQAIAGTINIVLREGYQQKDIQLKLTDSIEQGLHSPNVSLTAPGKLGALSWLLNGTLAVNHGRDAGTSTYQNIRPDGTLAQDQARTSQGDSTNQLAFFAPRLSYRFDNGDTLNLQPFIGHNSNHGSANGTITEMAAGAPPPDYALALGSSSNSGSFIRGFGNWLHKIDSAAKLDVKFGFGAGVNSSDTRRQQYNGAGTATDLYVTSDDTRNTGLSTGGKYTRSMGQGHLLAAGWDLEAGHRVQNGTSLRNDQPLFAASGTDLTADTRRFAGYVQDEWDITPQWGVYLGLRWEGIRTNASNQGNDTESTSSVWSPVLHTVWRIPGHEKDQVRASLTQSYRAPQLNDLIALPVYSQVVGDPTRPDRSGNPNLKPELAKGLDLAYEHYVGKSGILSASAFVRQIDDLMRRTLSSSISPIDGQLHYLSTPSNVGSARTSGIELEAKLQLSDLMADAPNMDLRANYSHFWSSVDGIMGPDNRLDQQAKQTANVGFDYRVKKSPLAFGGSLNWTPATIIQTSNEERVSTGVKRQLDAYALWKFSSNTQLRLSGNNLLHKGYDTGDAVAANNALLVSQTATHTYTTVSLKLEMKL